MAKYMTLNGISVSVGDTVRVHQKIQEGDKTRIQIFEGVLVAVTNRGQGKSFRVRKIAAGGIGVERIFPVGSPSLEKVELKQAGEVRRAKLFYLRSRVGKAASRIKKKVDAVVNINE